MEWVSTCLDTNHSISFTKKLSSLYTFPEEVIKRNLKESADVEQEKKLQQEKEIHRVSKLQMKI